MRQLTLSVHEAPIGGREGQRTPERLPTNKATRAVAIQPGETLAFSIPEFCRRHGISRAHFYNLWKGGAAPLVMRVGRRTLISAEAAAEWRMRMETLTVRPRLDQHRRRDEGQNQDN
jgi:predicted DNA-binding transcriptional regulator AlpA